MKRLILLLSGEGNRSILLKLIFMRNKLYLLLVLLVGIVQVGMAQEKTITGVVTDADDGSPLPGVSVVIKGTHLGPATDAMGKYSIRIDG